MPVTSKNFVILNTPISVVWTALTKSQHWENWFCEQADIVFDPGGKFNLQGKSLFWNRSEGTIRELAAPKVIRFSWLMSGVETDVCFELKARSDHQTSLVVTHTYPAGYDFGFGTMNSDPFHILWRYYLATLKGYLELNKSPLRMDFTLAAENSFSHEMIVATAKEKAFSALTEGPDMDNWISEKGLVEKEVGGRYSFGWAEETETPPNGPQTVTAFEQNSRLGFIWNTPIGPTQMIWEFREEKVTSTLQTRIRLTQSGFAGHERQFLNTRLGWAGRLIVLAFYLEKNLIADWSGAGQPD